MTSVVCVMRQVNDQNRHTAFGIDNVQKVQVSTHPDAIANGYKKSQQFYIVSWKRYEDSTEVLISTLPTNNWDLYFDEVPVLLQEPFVVINH